MKHLLTIFAFIPILSNITAQPAESYICRYDNLALYDSYETKTEAGKLIHKWKCAGGHAFWIVFQGFDNSGSGRFNKSANDNSFIQWVNGLESGERQILIIEQQDKISFAKVTLEQQKEYFRLKNEVLKMSEENSQNQMEDSMAKRKNFMTLKGILKFTGYIVGFNLIFSIISYIAIN